MKVGILADGHDTQLAEETEICLKPMVEIGGLPMLCQIIKQYAHFTYSDFVGNIGFDGR